MQGATWLPAELSRRSRVRINQFRYPFFKNVRLLQLTVAAICVEVKRCHPLRRFFDVLFTRPFPLRVGRRRPIPTRSTGDKATRFWLWQNAQRRGRETAVFHFYGLSLLPRLFAYEIVFYALSGRLSGFLLGFSPRVTFESSYPSHRHYIL